MWLKLKTVSLSTCDKSTDLLFTAISKWRDFIDEDKVVIFIDKGKVVIFIDFSWNVTLLHINDSIILQKRLSLMLYTLWFVSLWVTLTCITNFLFLLIFEHTLVFRANKWWKHALLVSDLLSSIKNILVKYFKQWVFNQENDILSQFVSILMICNISITLNVSDNLGP